MAGKEKYNIHLTATNIGPHENLNQPCDAGEDEPIRIGVFASNGGGKSSLSRQFRLLELDQTELPLSNKYITLGKNQANFKFKLFRQDVPSEKHEFEIAHSVDKKPQITDNSDLIFHVFNSDYVRESIEPSNYGQDKKIEGYIIGKDAVDLTKENSELEALRKEYLALKEKIDHSIQVAQTELRQIGIRTNTNEYASIKFDNLIDGNYYVPQEATTYKELRASLKKLEGIPDDLLNVTLISPLNGNSQFIDNIITYLQENISVSELSEEFKTKISAKDGFIRAGVELLHEERKTCPFCEQELGDNQLLLIDDFIAYLKDAETVYKNKLRSHLSNLHTLKDLLSKKHNEFLKTESQFNHNKGYFPSYKDKRLSAISDPTELFLSSEIEQAIDSRIENITLVPTVEQVKIMAQQKEKIQLYIDAIIKYIVSNNSKIDSINNVKSNTNAEVLSLKKRICNAKFIELQSTLNNEVGALRQSVKNGKEKAEQIRQLNRKAKKSKKDVIVDTFNNLMMFIFSDKYVFNADDSSLKIKNFSLKANAHDILSDGEKNVIAFCYFIAETHALIENESDYDKLFFVIDDPISSMDFHYTYSLCRILERLHDYFSYSHRKKLRFILFTHNIEFMSTLMRNNVIQKRYVLTPGKIRELKKELVMPYHEHLSDIYCVANDKLEPTHTTPNSMRNVLETIGRFENPNQNLISFVDGNDELKKCSSLYNMIQDMSHGIIRSQPAILPDDIKKGCKTIIAFLENRYKGQIENVKKTV